MCLKRQFGFNFLELLIVLIIVTSMMLPMIGWQIASLQGVQASFQQSMAAIQAQNFLERLRASASPVSRNREFDLWQAQLPLYLNQGKGNYQCEDLHACTIEVEWIDHGAKNFTLNAVI
jgi:Tfp pilus assembly protein PilV